MLRQLRENSRSVIIWVLFGIIIAFFIISFGPQAGQDQFTCVGRQPYVVKVNDVDVSENSWRFGMNGLGFGSGSSARARQSRARETVMDGLIERELFAQLADRLGFRIPDSLLERRIAEGDVYILGRAVPGNQIYFDDIGAFDYERLERYVGTLGLTNIDQFREEQRRELLANLGRETLLHSARVSPDEVLARYQQQNTTVSFDFVKFDPREYARRLDPSPEEVQKYLASHEAEVKQKYETDERLYKGVKPQVKVRHIFVRRDGEPGGEDPTMDPGHAKASAARARIEGGESFAKVARELTDDERTKARGGYLGWRPATSPVGGPEVAEAIKELGEGDLSEVITTDRGFYVVAVEARREGDLSFDDVKLEIAEKMAIEFFADEGARQDAKAALERVEASGKKLAEVFPKPEIDKGEPNVIEGQEPEEEQQEDEAQDGTKTGRILYEGPNIPASFQSDPRQARDARGGDDDDAPAAAGSGVPAVDPDVPRPEGLPEPVVESSGPIVRAGAILAGANMDPYIGRSPKLASDLFESLETGKLAGDVYKVDDAYMIVQVTDRSDPDMESFEKQKGTLYERFRREKNQRTADQWALDACRAAAERNQISVNAQYVTYTDPDSEDAKPLPMTYKLCSGGGIPAM